MNAPTHDPSPSLSRRHAGVLIEFWHVAPGRRGGDAAPCGALWLDRDPRARVVHAPIVTLRRAFAMGLALVAEGVIEVADLTRPAQVHALVARAAFVEAAEDPDALGLMLHFSPDEAAALPADPRICRLRLYTFFADVPPRWWVGTVADDGHLIGAMTVLEHVRGRATPRIRATDARPFERRAHERRVTPGVATLDPPPDYEARLRALRERYAQDPGAFD